MGIFREAWAEMCAWVATLQIATRPVYCPNVLEMYLDFMLFMGGERMITDIDIEHRGDWISNQLDRFLRGFPKLLEGKLSLVLPRIHEVREMMMRAREEIGPTPPEVHASQIWRRWSPGAPGTQMQTAHRKVPIMWWGGGVSRRLRNKTYWPQWRQQARSVERFYLKMEAKGWNDIVVGGITMRDWLLEQGVFLIETFYLQSP